MSVHMARLHDPFLATYIPFFVKKKSTQKYLAKYLPNLTNSNERKIK